MLSLEELLEPKTQEELEASTLDTILAIAVQLGFPVAAWPKGRVGRTIVKIMAWLYAGFLLLVAVAIGGGFLDYAVGSWLTLLARNQFGVERIRATFAAAREGIELTNTLAGRFEFDAGDLTFVRSTDKKTYTNTSAGVLEPAGQPGDVLLLDVRAVEVGSASSASPGDIDTLETGLLGVTVTNPVALIGLDEESDPDLRQRCRDKLGSLSPNGPKAAYRFFARSATRADGTPIGVTRVGFGTPPGDGSLTVYVATASGAVAGTVGDLATDLGQVDDIIQRLVVPEGVGPVTVASAVAHDIGPIGSVDVDSAAGLSTADVQASIALALRNYFKTVPIGGVAGKVYLTALIGVIWSASPYILRVTLTTPGGDVTIAPNEVPTFSAATIAVSQVTP